MTLALNLPDELLEAIADRVLDRLDRSAESTGYLDVAGAAEFLACGKSRIYALVSAKRIPVHRDGSRLLFDPSELREYVERGGARRPWPSFTSFAARVSARTRARCCRRPAPTAGWRSGVAQRSHFNERNHGMTDDYIERRKALANDMARKACWTVEHSRAKDRHGGRVPPDVERELAKRFGVRSAEAPATPPTSDELLQQYIEAKAREDRDAQLEPNPGDGGARTDQPKSTSTDAAGIRRRIAEAQEAGDVKASISANTELLMLRAEERKQQQQ